MQDQDLSKNNVLLSAEHLSNYVSAQAINISTLIDLCDNEIRALKTNKDVCDAQLDVKNSELLDKAIMVIENAKERAADAEKIMMDLNDGFFVLKQLMRGR